VKVVDFETVTHGKWILAGEHAVIRGFPALVFPLHEKKLTLQYTATPTTLQITCESPSGKLLSLLSKRLLMQGIQVLGLGETALTGVFYLTSDIPIGVGMGASAALSVAIARWFVYQGLVQSEACFHFAKSLEDVFHGSSSGLDIAGVSAESGILFEQGKQTPLASLWQPFFYLSSCHEMGMTLDCIQQVAALHQAYPTRAVWLDHQMNQSVKLAHESLNLDASCGLPLLVTAINLARDCFEQWGLVSASLRAHMDQLKAEGALAVKPTGAGKGGHVVSLWNEAISRPELERLIL